MQSGVRQATCLSAKSEWSGWNSCKRGLVSLRIFRLAELVCRSFGRSQLRTATNGECINLVSDLLFDDEVLFSTTPSSAVPS